MSGEANTQNEVGYKGKGRVVERDACGNGERVHEFRRERERELSEVEGT